MFSGSIGPGNSFFSPNSASSFMRLGITEIELVEERIVKKFGHLRQLIRRRRLVPNKNFSDYSQILGYAIAQDLPLPDWLDDKGLSQVIVKLNEEYLEERPNLKDRLQRVQDASGREEKCESLTDFLELNEQTFREGLPKWSQANRKLFFNSDLPFSFYCDMSTDMNTRVIFNKVMLHKTEQMHKFVRLTSDRGLHRMRKVISEKQKEVRPMTRTLDEMVLSVSKALFYVCAWNASSPEDLLKPSYLSSNKLDLNVFRKLNQDYHSNLQKFREEVNQHDRAVFTREIKVGDSTEKLWKDIAANLYSQY